MKDPLKENILKAKDLLVSIAYSSRWNQDEFEELNKALKIICKFYSKLDK